MSQRLEDQVIKAAMCRFNPAAVVKQGLTQIGAQHAMSQTKKDVGIRQIRRLLELNG